MNVIDKKVEKFNQAIYNLFSKGLEQSVIILIIITTFFIFLDIIFKNVYNFYFSIIILIIAIINQKLTLKLKNKPISEIIKISRIYVFFYCLTIIITIFYNSNEFMLKSWLFIIPLMAYTAFDFKRVIFICIGIIIIFLFFNFFLEIIHLKFETKAKIKNNLYYKIHETLHFISILSYEFLFLYYLTEIKNKTFILNFILQKTRKKYQSKRNFF